MATSILVAVVRNGAMAEDFDYIDGVDIAASVRAFKAHLKEVRKADLLGIEPWHMTVFGPWASASAVPDDTAVATHGRGLDPAEIFEPLIVGKQRAYFLVRITTPPVAAGESGVELARHALSVPTNLCRP
jgi:hypothetical protein